MKTINYSSNDSLAKTNESSADEHKESDYPYTVTVGDTTVRLRFSEKGDLTAQLANVFSSMLG